MSDQTSPRTTCRSRSRRRRPRPNHADRPRSSPWSTRGLLPMVKRMAPASGIDPLSSGTRANGVGGVVPPPASRGSAQRGACRRRCRTADVLRGGSGVVPTGELIRFLLVDEQRRSDETRLTVARVELCFLRRTRLAGLRNQPPSSTRSRRGWDPAAARSAGWRPLRSSSARSRRSPRPRHPWAPVASPTLRGADGPGLRYRVGRRRARGRCRYQQDGNGGSRNCAEYRASPHGSPLPKRSAATLLLLE